ncbi:MAG TPA: PAS domain-containing protein, partial [Opitutus sp.]|nr:PAS domain-containing protein [Opitutus sp.]
MKTSSSQTLDHPAGEIERNLVMAFLENVPDHVYFKDRESRFIAASASHAKSFGCASVADMIGKTDFDFFGEAHARSAFNDEQRIIRTGEPLVGLLEKETWPDGRVTWVLTNKLPLRNEHGEIVGTFGISKDVTKTKETELALERAQRELVDASRIAGMAEVATGVLHNVGNVLNSLNVSATVLTAGLKQSKVESLTKVAALLREHAADLGKFLTVDPKGRRIPEFLESLAEHSLAERDRLLKEAESLQKNVDHIKEIVSMQQAYATMVGVIEPLDAIELMEDSLRMNAGALVRHAVGVTRDFQPVPRVMAEKAKVLQILVNLIRNAKYA